MRGQLLSSFSALTPIRLHSTNLSTVDHRPGVYRLFLDGQPVYVGKADKSLSQRLEKHYNKLRGRIDTANTPPQRPLIERMGFYCLYIDEDLHALAPEKMLIHEFKPFGQAPWNFNGFGNNDPGRERDTSLVKENHFDRLFPINLDYEVTLNGTLGKDSLRALLRSLKACAPFNIRFPDRNAPTDLEISISSLMPMTFKALTVREWLHHVAHILPHGWLVTTLPGYVIIYQEKDPQRYPSRSGSWKSGPRSAYAGHSAEFGKSAEIKEVATDD